MWKSVDTDFPTQHTLLQICHLVASVLERGTTIIAWSAVWKCSGEERMDVRQRSRGVGGVQ